MRGRSAILVLASVGVTIGLALSACSAPSAGAPTASPKLDCERGGYACTLGEVGDAVFARGDALLLELATKLRNGASLGDLVQAALAQPDVVEARVDQQGTAMYFLIDGGTPRFVHDLAGPGTASWVVEPTTTPTSSARGGALSPSAVVGEGTPRDEHDGTQRKTALVLSPYAWDFGTDDSAPGIVDRLDHTYDYSTAWAGFPVQAGKGVGYEPNASKGDFNVTVEDFMGWSTYDVVFISSHGTSLGCTGTVHRICASGIFIGMTFEPCTYWKKTYPDLDGIRCGTTPFTTSWGDPVYEVGLSSDFFQQHYGADTKALRRTVVVFDSCESLQNDAFGRVLAAQTSAFFGWTASVFSGESKETTSALFGDLLDGQTTGTAMADLKQSGLTERTPVDGAPTPTFRKLGPQAEDLRIIDLPALMDATGAARLQKGASVTVAGVPGDGVNDEYDFLVDVRGVINPNGGGTGSPPSSGAAGLYDLHFLLDGTEIGVENLGHPTPNRTTVTQLDATTYRMRYPVKLPFDVPKDGRDARLEVRVTLPEGGSSSHAVDVTLRGILCDYDLTLSGGLTGTSRGPASFTPGSDGSLEIDLNGSLSEGSTGDALLAGVRIPAWDGSTGTLSIPDASASSPDGSAIYKAGTDLDCPDCGGTLTIDTADATSIAGSLRVTMPTLVAATDTPPPTVATASFHAVLQTSGDPFAPYGACTDAWAAR